MNTDKTKPHWFSSVFICVHLWLLSSFVSANAVNPPSAFTGGFSEPTCVQCHTGSLNPHGGSVTLIAPLNYTAGSLYSLQVQVSDASASAWGFELSARLTNGSQAGTLGGTANVAVTTANSGGFPVQYAAPSTAVVVTGQGTTFTVPWTAPPGGGEVVFSVVGLAANHDGTPAGDRTYSSEFRATSGIPQIGANGVVSAASYQATLAPGQLISIFGQNLTVGGPYAAAAFPLPMILGLTTVTFSGLQAPLVYVSSTQINAQVPNEFQPGTLSVAVHFGSTASVEAPVTLASAAPAIFTMNATGAGPGSILHADYTNVDAGHPAKGGETVLIFATGLGVVTPQQADGAAAPGIARTILPVTVAIGGAPASVSYAGLAPGFAGLYQINAIVPGGVSGIVSVRVTAGTVTSPDGVTIQLQ